MVKQERQMLNFSFVIHKFRAQNVARHWILCFFFNILKAALFIDLDFKYNLF